MLKIITALIVTSVTYLSGCAHRKKDNPESLNVKVFVSDNLPRVTNVMQNT